MGGDVDAGNRLKSTPWRNVFDRINGSGGEAGPDPTGWRKAARRRYLLESISRRMRKSPMAFNNAVTLKNGEMQLGTVKAKRQTNLFCKRSSPALPVKVKNQWVQARENAPSGMRPQSGRSADEREIRDVIEYLGV
jgi:hypothetical protein